MTKVLSTRDLAIRGINLLEKAIERDFSLKVRMGAELEFVLKPKEDAQGELSATGAEFLEQMDADLRFDKHAKRESRPYFGKSRIVGAFYREEGLNQYEVTIDHRRCVNGAMLLSHLAEARRLIVKGAAEHELDVDFSPKPYDESWDKAALATSSALQINLSLEDAGGNNRLFDTISGTQQSGNLGQYVAEHMLPMIAEAQLLHAPTENSYKRYAHSNKNKTTVPDTIGTSTLIKSAICRIQKPEHGNYRLENRLAGADADPAHVMLAMLAGVYEALSAGQVKVQTSPKEGSVVNMDVEKHIPRAVRKTLREAIEDFSCGDHLRSVLNMISANERLGDTFCDAVLDEALTPKTSSSLEAVMRR